MRINCVIFEIFICSSLKIVVANVCKQQVSSIEIVYSSACHCKSHPEVSWLDRIITVCMYACTYIVSRIRSK